MVRKSWVVVQIKTVGGNRVADTQESAHHEDDQADRRRLQMAARKSDHWAACDKGGDGCPAHEFRNPASDHQSQDHTEAGSARDSISTDDIWGDGFGQLKRSCRLWRSRAHRRHRDVFRGQRNFAADHEHKPPDCLSQSSCLTATSCTGPARLF